MRVRSALLSIATALLAVMAFASASASAKTLCVDQSHPAIPAGCDSSFDYDSAGLQSAATYANSVTDYLGEDTIKIAPGTLVLDANVSVDMQFAFGATHIVGAGRDLTTLQLEVAPFGSLTGLSFDATDQPSSSISDLTIAVPGTTAGIIGVNAKSGTIRRTRFTVVGDSDSNHQGLATSGGSATTVADSVFSLSGIADTALTAVAANGDLVLSKVDISAASPFSGQHGVVTTGVSSNVVIDASQFENLDPALRVVRGTVKVLDSLLLNPPGEADTAFRFESAGPSDAALILSGVTAVGARSGIAISTSTASPDVDVNNSVIQTAGSGSADIVCSGSSGFAPDVHFRNSILDKGVATPFCHYTELATIDRLVNPPVFAGLGDYRPAPGSPQVDAGDVTWPTMMGDPSPLLDLAGAPRLVDGTGDGTAKLDIGAYEYQPPVPPIAAPTQPAATLTLRFGKPIGKFKIRKKKPQTFTFTTAKKKPRLPVTSNLATPVELTLARSKAGYVTARKCAKTKPKSGKKKRCDIPLRGKLALKLPAGTSYLTFSGKWNKKKLKPGKYALTLRAPGGKDSIKSVLNVIR